MSNPSLEATLLGLALGSGNRFLSSLLGLGAIPSRTTQFESNGPTFASPLTHCPTQHVISLRKAEKHEARYYRQVAKENLGQGQ